MAQNKNKSSGGRIKGAARSIETLYRNAIRANLELTALADNKASIMISVNGFILTVIVTAGSYLIQSTPKLLYPFTSVLLTCLASITFAVLAVRPRVQKEPDTLDDIHNDRSSVLYFHNMARLSADDYVDEVKRVVGDLDTTQTHIIRHIHGLGSGLESKFRWLKLAYTVFTVGLIVSSALFLWVMSGNRQQELEASWNRGFSQFNSIFEPSGAVQLNNGDILIVEDEQQQSFRLARPSADGRLQEIGALPVSENHVPVSAPKLDDLEAVTSDPRGFAYAITSHSRTKAGLRKPSREQLVKLDVSDGLKAIRTARGLLDALKNLHPVYARAIDDPRSKTWEQELNIEALTWDVAHNALLIGFRSPLIEGKASIVRLNNVDEVFAGAAPDLSAPVLLDLHGNGIRGMVYDDKLGGYLLIGGAVGSRKGPFALWFWSGRDAEVRAVRVKGHSSIGFAEGIATLRGPAGRESILMVSDDGEQPLRGARYLMLDHEQLLVQ